MHNNRLWAGWVSYRPHIGNVYQGMFVRNMLMVINGLGGRHTHIYTHTRKRTDAGAKAILRNQVRAATGRTRLI